MDNQESLEELVLNTLDIPPMPAVAVKVSRAIRDPDASSNDIARIIGEDPGITIKVLRVANSSLYANSAESLPQAVIALGFKAVLNLILADATKNIHRSSGTIEDYLWKHSIGSAVAANYVAKYAGLSTVDEAFTVGLLHDVGKIILNNYDTKKFSQTISMRNSKNISSCEAEFEIFGFDHTAVGGAVLKRWDLSDGLVGAVRFHHRLNFVQKAPLPVKKLAYVSNLANRITYVLQLNNDVKHSDRNNLNETVRVLELTSDKIMAITHDTKENFEEEFHAFS